LTYRSFDQLNQLVELTSPPVRTGSKLAQLGGEIPN
jgi:hypothetical protein